MEQICQEGKAITGYYGYPYLNKEYGAAQFIVSTQINKDKKQLEVTSLDTHVSGRTVWKFALSDMNVDFKNSDVLSKRVIAKRVDDGGGMAVISLVNADVLPSFLDDDIITAQMIGFPVSINYYENEEAYAEAQPESKIGKKFLLADGSMFPSGLLTNHSPDNPDCDKEHFSDNYMVIRGTVKSANWGEVEFGENKFNSFIRCIINTEHGDLEIVHTPQQVEDSERNNIKVGAVVNGVFILSGDVAIYEYENGPVFDEEHNLSLIRYTLQKGDPERLTAVLKEDSEYISEANNNACHKGADKIIERFKYVRNANSDSDYYAYKATITHIDDGEKLPYKEGKRCVVLAKGENGGHYEIAPELLNTEQIAVLLMYPFWSRMGGNFETAYLDDGRLKKYLLALKKKHLEEIETPSEE